MISHLLQSQEGLYVIANNIPVVLSILPQDVLDSGVMLKEVKPYSSKIIQIKSMIIFEVLEMLILISDKAGKTSLCVY